MSDHRVHKLPEVYTCIGFHGLSRLVHYNAILVAACVDDHVVLTIGTCKPRDSMRPWGDNFLFLVESDNSGHCGHEAGLVILVILGCTNQCIIFIINQIV